MNRQRIELADVAEDPPVAARLPQAVDALEVPVAPHTTVPPWTAPTLFAPHTTVLPHDWGSLHTASAPQTTVLLHDVLAPHTTVVPHAVSRMSTVAPQTTVFPQTTVCCQ